MTKIRTALVGCGRISANHFNAITSNKAAFKLVGVCDIDKERADVAAETQSCPAFYSLKELLIGCSPDLLVICTPSGLHPSLAIEAAKMGVNILSEKPMATRLEDAEQMISACTNNKVQLHIVHQNRLNSTIQLLKKAIDKGRFGKIYDVQVNVFWTRPQEYYDAAKWRGTWALDGGAFMNQASHYLDLLDYLMGDAESVMCFTGTLARHIEAEDSGVAALRFKNGALGTLNVTMLTYPKNLEGSITILGEKGSVRVGGVAVNKIEVWEFSDYDDDDKQVATSSYETQSVYGFGHSGYYKYVAESILNHKPALVDGQEGLRSLKLILALYKSAREGVKVDL
jgi:UDP-N-acetyl-2-amino-2-deoxyglucuronate dehydrogenase